MTARLRGSAGDSDGFTIIEVLIAMVVLTIGLIAVAGMFPMGYRQVTDAGRMTLAVSTARQILEDVQTVPFASLANLNTGGGFDSNNPATLPPFGPGPGEAPERGLARRWAFAVAGQANGFPAPSAQEVAAWQALSPFGGRAQVTVVQPFAGSATLCQVRVTVTVPALSQTVTLSTVLVSM